MWQLFKIVNFIFLLVSSYAWFGFMLPLNLVPVGVSALMTICFMFGKFKIQTTSRAYALIGMITFYAIYSTITVDLSLGLLNFVNYLPATFVFMLDKKYQKDLLQSVTKWLCVLLLISLCAYLVSKVISLPHTPFNVPDNDFYKTFDNYFFFLKSGMSDDTLKAAGAMRFSSVFLEPGHLSMICTLMLFANKFKMKEQPLLWVAIACVVFSFSLVGYIIVIVSLILLKIRNIPSAVGITILVGGSWLFVTQIWDNGNNPVNILIFERLEFDKEKGISGNNRTVKQTDYFYKQCVADGRIITGVGSQKDYGARIKGSGFKIFLLRYGVIAAVFVTIIYLMFIPKHANIRYAASFLTIIFLLFMQRAYPSWYSWLLFYVAAIGASRGTTFFSAEANAKWLEKKRKKLMRKNGIRMPISTPIPTTSE